jgi:hypothetical protein
VRNYSRPSKIREDTIELRFDVSIPPEICVAVLTAASSTCRVPLASLAPEVTAPFWW